MEVSIYAIPGILIGAHKMKTEDLVFESVCKTFGVNPEVVRKNDKVRKREYVMARQMTMTILHLKHKFTIEKSAKYFDKNHATVIHGIKTMKNLLKTDIQFRTDYGHLFDGIKFPNYN